jgi:hypothetical protein
MSVLVWRLYRGQAAIAAAVLAAFAAVLVVTGLSMAAQWHHLLLGCAANGDLITGSSRAQSNAVASCLQHAGFRSFTTFQPADRFWAFQGIETGIFVAIALVLLAVTYVVITRRDA